MTIEEATKLMSPEAVNHLRDLTNELKEIDVSKKKQCDIIMWALVNAIMNDGVILHSSLDDGLVNMMNSSTRTVSCSKLRSVMKTIKESQKLKCYFEIYEPDGSKLIQRFEFDNTKNKDFNYILDFVLDYFKITPQMIKEKLTEFFKPTVVINIYTLINKYMTATDEEKKDFKVSILTITRLVNMVNHVIYCKFERS
jgi:hypothetical protein